MEYTYDYAGSRTLRDVRVDEVDSGYSDVRDQKYEYDGLHRLKNVDEGTLAGGSISSPAAEQDWGLDQLGNWTTFDKKASGSYTLQQQRYHNAVNEIDGNGGNSIALQSGGAGANWADPVHDAAGNMTTIPKPAAPTTSFTLKYDAWNRLVTVSDSGGTVTTNEYDGLGQRIVKDVSGTADDREFYYNEQWQPVSEKKGGSHYAVYFWHPYYIDALAQRVRDDEIINFMHDGNFNVTAAYKTGVGVVERYSYSPYGEVTVLDEDFEPDSVGDDGLSDIDNVHLYTGRERDPETGLQLNRHRFYASHLGRWVNRDPIRYWGGMNLYGYVGDMPNIYLDPSGLQHRPPNRPPDAPPGTLPIDEYFCDRERIHRIKDNLADEGVGPNTWVGVSPDENVIVPDANGLAEDLGPWQDYDDAFLGAIIFEPGIPLGGPFPIPVIGEPPNTNFPPQGDPWPWIFIGIGVGIGVGIGLITPIPGDELLPILLVP